MASALLPGATFLAHAQATTYAATAPNYTTLVNFTSCDAGPCSNYSTAMSPSGWLTTSAPLAANLTNFSVEPVLAGFSFSDGLNTYASTDPSTVVFRFLVSTDASGSITWADMLLQRWLTGTAPHALQDRISWMSSGQAFHNLACTGLTTGDRCATALRDASHSRGRPIAFAWRTASDLAITKTDGVTSVAAGGSLTYTITASNAGPDNATGAIVTDTLPASLTGATWTCVGAGGGTCTAAGSGNINDTVNLPAGASVTYTVVATVSAPATGTISNTATVTAPAGFIEAHPANNTATDTDTVTQSGDLGITLSGTAGPVPPGAAVNYTLVARNPGPSNATGVAVASTLAAQLQGLSWACVGSGGGTCTASGAGNVADTVNLPAGASVAYTLSGTVVPDATPGDATSTAALTPPAGFSDPSPTNNSASAITSIHASVAVPTLSEWAAGLMAALMALGAACGLRRRDRQRG